VNKIEKHFYDNVGTNNSKVFPRINSVKPPPPVEDEKMSGQEELGLLSKPVRVLMNEQKF
jgi:hypothetical protein